MTLQCVLEMHVLILEPDIEGSVRICHHAWTGTLLRVTDQAVLNGDFVFYHDYQSRGTAAIAGGFGLIFHNSRTFLVRFAQALFEFVSLLSYDASIAKEDI